MKSQFEIFDEKYPDIYMFFVLYSEDAMDCGITKIRADEVLHRARWDVILLWRPEEDMDTVLNELKMVYANQYGMKLIKENASFQGFFDLTVGHN
jgi:hypothetical protein